MGNASPRPAIPDASSFRYWTSFRVRYDDLDTQRHLNHVTTIAYAETARIEYLVKLGFTTAEKIAFLIATVRCDYFAPAFFEQEVQVGVRISRLGRTSFDVESLIRREDGTLVAFCSSVLVGIEPDTSTPRPLSPEFRRLIAEREGIALDATAG